MTTPVPPVVSTAVSMIGWPGVVLPRTRVARALLYPVVVIDEVAWATRESSGQGPTLDRSVLASWEAPSRPGPNSPPSPVHVVGFVSTARLRSAFEVLDELSGYAAGMVITSSGRQPNSLAIAEANLYDVSLAWCRRDEDVQVVWRGRQGPIDGADGRSVALRHKEEALYAWARANQVHLQDASLRSNV